MKYTWEESDIIPGRWADHKSNVKFLHCIIWQHVKGSSDNAYGVCDIGTDGLSLLLGSKKDVADYLTKNNYYPCDRSERAISPQPGV